MVCKEVTGVLDCTAVLDQPNLMVFIIPDLSTIDGHLTGPADGLRAASMVSDRQAGHQPPDEANFSVSSHDTGWSRLQQKLSAHIQGSLSSHYVPTTFVKIAGHFPLTQNGKLDKKQLLKMGYEELKAGLEIKNVQHLSQQVWMVNLPAPPEAIQDTSNFISLGGDSLAAVRVINQLESLFGCSLPSLLDVLVNREFWHFVEELQRYVSLRLSDTSWTQTPLRASRLASDSLGSNNVTSSVHYDTSAGEKTVNGAKQDIHSLGVYNKRLQTPKHKQAVADGWTGSKVAKLTDMSTPSATAALAKSLPLLSELHEYRQSLVDTHSNASSKSQEKPECHKENLGMSYGAKKYPEASTVTVEAQTRHSSQALGKLESEDDNPGLSWDVDAALRRQEGLILPVGTCSRSSSMHQKRLVSRQGNPELGIDADATALSHTDHLLPSGTLLESSHKHQGRENSQQDGSESGTATDDSAERQVTSNSPIRIISRGSVRQKGGSTPGVEPSRRLTTSIPSDTCEYKAYHCHAMESNATVGGSLTQTLKTVLELTLTWKFDTKKCVDASPLVVEQGGVTLVYIGSHSGQFSAIDIFTGSCLWSVTLPDRIESSACCSLCGSYVIVGCYDGMLYVINATSGFVVWKFQTGDMVKCSPVVDDHTGFVICGSHDGYLYCLDVKEKLCVWKCHLGGGSVFSSPVVDTAARLVYAASLAGTVLAICADSGTVRWVYDLQKPVFSSLSLIGHSLLIGCVDGNLYSLNSLGHKEWTFSTKAPVFSTPVVHKSSIVLGSHDHHVYCLTDSGQQTWTFQASSPVYATAFASALTTSTENDQYPCTDPPLENSTLKALLTSCAATTMFQGCDRRN
ncbi:unnamed protein product [Candidula unifasciata]|uniref:Fatty acid synthase n=1 Tax=Candidula unifasciata TaxID=100452 RepID=A0A8S3ZVA7_9EUPU|nr:unnamed protein product [Candidula unifasciata]